MTRTRTRAASSTLAPSFSLRSMFSLVASCVVAFGALGCDGEPISDGLARVSPSTGLKTSQLDATFHLSGTRGEATVLASASFMDSVSGDVISLADADEVYCDGVRLAQSSTFLGSELPRKEAGHTWQFEFRRSGESITVPVTQIEEIGISEPAAADELHRTRPLTIRWTPASGSTIDAQLFANCAMTSGRSETESGAIVLPAFEPAGVPGGPQNATNPPCDGTVSLTRTATTNPSSAFHSVRGLSEEVDRVRVSVVD